MLTNQIHILACCRLRRKGKIKYLSGFS